eukprot:scaffold22804_cov74-Phaeocystis_antarctica.AAC.4
MQTTGHILYGVGGEYSGSHLQGGSCVIRKKRRPRLLRVLLSAGATWPASTAMQKLSLLHALLQDSLHTCADRRYQPDCYSS